MIEAIITLSVLGGGLGAFLGFAAKGFAVEESPIAQEIEGLLPGTNCGQCGFPGCKPAAEAIADGNAPVTACPPGGADLAKDLADKLGVEVDLSSMEETAPIVAFIFEDSCIGCTKCRKECPTDAIIGASKQMHTVVNDACTGCEKCIEACPTASIIVRPVEHTLQTWHWPKPDNRALYVEAS